MLIFHNVATNPHISRPDMSSQYCTIITEFYPNTTAINPIVHSYISVAFYQMVL